MPSDCVAEITRSEGALRIALPTVLDRNNAPDLLSAIREKTDAGIQKIVFDAAGLRYISADGLDVILEIKKRCPDIVIEQARIGVCDTLRSFGFDHFVNITKQYRFISVKESHIIGQGGHGAIYQIGEDTIIKVYKDHSPLRIIERERQYARNAFIHGIPTAIAYDVVETEYGYGVIFEMINGMTLGAYLDRFPEKLEEYSVRFADLLRTLHTTAADPDLYMDFHDVYLERAERSKAFLSEKGAETLKQMILSIPRGSGMVHGDYHPNNVMVDGEGELLLIDMADISRGNGFFDVGGSYLLLRSLASQPVLRRKARKVTGLDAKACLKMWDILVRRYFGTEDEEKLRGYDRQFRAFSRLRIAVSLGMDSSRSRLVTRLMALYARMFVLPHAKQYRQLFTSLRE